MTESSLGERKEEEGNGKSGKETRLIEVEKEIEYNFQKERPKPRAGK